MVKVQLNSEISFFGGYAKTPILRYRRQDADCLGKLLEMNLGMGLTLRETASIYSWMSPDQGWQPSWVWGLSQWLGLLLPVFWLLMRMGLKPPVHLLSDEKFAVLNGKKVYLFLVSEQELIWYGKWMATTDEDCFTQTIGSVLRGDKRGSSCNKIPGS